MPRPGNGGKIINLDGVIMVPEGVEPSTLALLAPHSNQLSYGTEIQLGYWVLLDAESGRF